MELKYGNDVYVKGKGYDKNLYFASEMKLKIKLNYVTFVKQSIRGKVHRCHLIMLV